MESRDFDSWCCIKGIDPLELPGYRYYNLALYALKEGRTEEQLEDLEKDLRRFDNTKHPLHQLLLGHSIFETEKQGSTNSDKSEDKHQYIPPWWKGEHQNFLTAQKTMKSVQTVPKSKS